MDASITVTGAPPAGRRIYANRTLNLRGIKAIGYDLDYTLVHYRVEPWERRAYERLRGKLREAGLPVDGLEFDHELVIRGLIVDIELGNLVKANRFGYVTRSDHGTRPVEFEAQRTTYGRTLADPTDERFVFLHTLFSISEACMYAQLVDRLTCCVDGMEPGDAGLEPAVNDNRDATDAPGAYCAANNLRGTTSAKRAKAASVVRSAASRPMAIAAMRASMVAIPTPFARQVR
jgi:hypothetical protein